MADWRAVGPIGTGFCYIVDEIDWLLISHFSDLQLKMALKYHVAVADWQAGGRPGRRSHLPDFPLHVSEPAHGNLHWPSRLPICHGSMKLQRFL